MLSDLIFQVVLIVLAAIFLATIYVERRKQRSQGENWFLLFAGSAFALLGVVLICIGILGMAKAFHGSPVPGAVISLVASS